MITDHANLSYTKTTILINFSEFMCDVHDAGMIPQECMPPLTLWQRDDLVKSCVLDYFKLVSIDVEVYRMYSGGNMLDDIMSVTLRHGEDLAYFKLKFGGDYALWFGDVVSVLRRSGVPLST